MRIVFFGTSSFAVGILEALAKNGDVVSAVTQPDRVMGRGYKLCPTPVKRYCLEAGIPLFTPEKVNSTESAEHLKSLKPDVFAVAAFGKILKKEILGLPPLGPVNVHGSLLPAYRGAAPIQWALINGETLTGITTFLMDEGIDTGKIILREQVDIAGNDDYRTLSDKLAKTGSLLLLRTLEEVEGKKVSLIPQDDSLATYAPKITPDMEWIDWSRPSERVSGLIRALSPSPGAKACFRNKIVKILKSSAYPADNYKGEPGKVLNIDRLHGIIVSCGTGAVAVRSVKPECRNEMGFGDFVNGSRLKAGDVFSGKVLQ